MFLLFSGCVGQGEPVDPQIDPPDLPETAHEACSNGPEMIVDLPDGFDDYEREGFVRYTEVVAPNGRAIPIFAQDEIGDAQILRARNLLRYFLSDVPGSLHGDDKSDVADAMADNAAVLVLVNGEHREGNEPRVPAQPLYDSETPVVGHDWFMDNDYEHRDAGPEEIFHLVHDTGIGTYLPGARPDYQVALDAEARAAMADGRWGIPVDPGVEDWLEELDREGSLAQEYIVSVLDSTYGLWAPWDEGEGGMWGIYIAKTRDEVIEKDPNGFTLLGDFLSLSWSLPEPVDPDFEGSLSLTFDEDEPYTHKTRYMEAVLLLGDGDASIVGNDLDNTFVSNAGSNRFEGGEGEDTVVYCGDAEDFQLSRDEGVTSVSDGNATDTLVDIEAIHFLDGVVEI